MEGLKVTRDVITDLLPLHESGEASEDTRRLVGEFLEADPEFARLVAKLKQTRMGAERPVPPPGVEMESLKRARRLMKGQSSVLAMAVYFSLAPFAFLVEEGRISWLLIREAPVVGGAYLFTGVALWIIYIVMRLKLRVL